jgi:hypothetical protein
MRKINLLISLFLVGFQLFSQKAIIVNGGQFGNPNEDANVMIYDVQSQNSVVIDTIRSSSVQDILIDGNEAYVLAQDSIVKYDLVSQQRLAATAFKGISTKAVAVNQNELIVGNWYGQSTSNIYFYDTQNLSLQDSIQSASKGAISILVNNGFAYVSQNSQNSSYQDTLGYIIRINLANKSITDTIEVAGYSNDIGQLVEKPDASGFYSINSVSNTITSVDYSSLTATNTSFNQDFKVSGQSHISIYGDTAFLRMNEGIGAINLANLGLIDSLIVDTVVTAFTYDTTVKAFYITQTDFFSYTQGRIYDRTGVKIGNLSVGYSPEVIRMYYDQVVGIAKENLQESIFTLFPNPATRQVQIELEKESTSLDLFVYSHNGQLVKAERALRSNYTLNVGDWTRGIYFINIQQEGKSYTRKLIVQ